MIAEPAHFVGSCSLGEPDPETGAGPDDFLLVPDRTAPLAFVGADGRVVLAITEPFVTDGATTPWFLQPVPWLRRYGRIRRAAFCHDWAWVLHHLGREPFGFARSNEMFRQACVACGLRRWQARLCWLAVTLFGWPMWVGRARRARQARECLAQARSTLRNRGTPR